MVEEGCFDSLKSGILVDFEERNVVVDEERGDWWIWILLLKDATIMIWRRGMFW